MMLSSAFKLLFFAMAFACVAARSEFEDLPLETEADEMDLEASETKQDETDNVEIDSLLKNQTKLPTSQKFPCPFPCKHIATVQYPFYYIHQEIYTCCKRANAVYQSCLYSTTPSWVCYVRALKMICRCINIKGKGK